MASCLLVLRRCMAGCTSTTGRRMTKRFLSVRRGMPNGTLLLGWWMVGWMVEWSLGWVVGWIVGWLLRWLLGLLINGWEMIVKLLVKGRGITSGMFIMSQGILRSKEFAMRLFVRCVIKMVLMRWRMSVTRCVFNMRWCVARFKSGLTTGKRRL